MAYSEEVNYTPGSTREPTHESQKPARIGVIGARSATGEALAFAALSQARAILAQHTTRYNHKR